jgi:hypothetical protein
MDCLFLIGTAPINWYRSLLFLFYDLGGNNGWATDGPDMFGRIKVIMFL